MKIKKRFVQNYEMEYQNYPRFKKFYLQDSKHMIEAIKNNEDLLKNSPYASKLISIKGESINELLMSIFQNVICLKLLTLLISFRRRQLILSAPKGPLRIMLKYIPLCAFYPIYCFYQKNPQSYLKQVNSFGLDFEEFNNRWLQIEQFINQKQQIP